MLEEFINASVVKGIPEVKDFNTGDNFGVGYYQFTTSHSHKGLKLRCSAAKGYLNPIKNRSNLKIVTNAHVEKINFNGTQVAQGTNPTNIGNQRCMIAGHAWSRGNFYGNISNLVLITYHP